MTGEVRGNLRPETYALDALIQATIERAKAQSNRGLSDTLLFMGNWHQAIPALVIQDPILEPVDKLIWMVIVLHARETGGRTAFPSYDTLCRKANVSSTSTISRAVSILRLTRWLTLCARVRGKGGQFKGNVYVLHDEPLPFVDALHLDSQFTAFVNQSCQHKHSRVKAVAQGVLDSLDEDIDSGHLNLENNSLLEQRAEAASVFSNNKQRHANTNHYFSFSKTVVEQLSNGLKGSRGVGINQDQISKAVADSRECSSVNYIKNTTTPSSQNSFKRELGFEVEKPPLIYPDKFSDNKRALADRYLVSIDREMRQSVLDELQGRLNAVQKGMAPIYDELRFLHALCKATRDGEFVVNHGLKVIEDRKRQQTLSRRTEMDRQKERTPEEKQRAHELGLQKLAHLKQLMGIDKRS